MTSDKFNTNQCGATGSSLGRFNFVALAGRDSPGRQERLASILAKVDDQNLEVVRAAFVDTHGIVRMRTIEALWFPRRARNGVPFTTALFGLGAEMRQGLE
jgi:hypothetical protein